jgi:hypothetical protein
MGQAGHIELQGLTTGMHSPDTVSETLNTTLQAPLLVTLCVPIFVCFQCLRRKPCYLPGSGHFLTTLQVILLGLMGLLDSQLWSGRLLSYCEVALLGFHCLG